MEDLKQEMKEMEQSIWEELRRLLGMEPVNENKKDEDDEDVIDKGQKRTYLKVLNRNGPTRSTASIGSSLTPVGARNSIAAPFQEGYSGFATNAEKTRGVKHFSYNELMDRKLKG